MTWSLFGLWKPLLLNIMYDKCNNYTCRLKLDRLDFHTVIFTALTHECPVNVNGHSSFLKVRALKSLPSTSHSQTQWGEPQQRATPTWPSCESQQKIRWNACACTWGGTSECRKSITKMKSKRMRSPWWIDALLTLHKLKNKESLFHTVWLHLIKRLLYWKLLLATEAVPYESPGRLSWGNKTGGLFELDRRAFLSCSHLARTSFSQAETLVFLAKTKRK